MQFLFAAFVMNCTFIILYEICGWLFQAGNGAPPVKSYTKVSLWNNIIGKRQHRPKVLLLHCSFCGCCGWDRRLRCNVHK